MKQKEQIQMAFEICERISKLESALWDLYFNEFLDIIMGEEDVKSSNDRDDLSRDF